MIGFTARLAENVKVFTKSCLRNARLSHVASINSFASLYVSLMRGTPLFLQFIFIYSALPQFGPQFVLAAFPSAVPEVIRASGVVGRRRA